MAPRIVLATPGGQQVIELRERNSLGRHPNNSIQLLDKIVSKEHCVIERRGGVLFLRDLGSLNGTYVNGERVLGERELKHGDEIALGGTRARFDDGSGRPLPALSPAPVSPPATPPPPAVLSPTQERPTPSTSRPPIHQVSPTPPWSPRVTAAGRVSPVPTRPIVAEIVDPPRVISDVPGVAAPDRGSAPRVSLNDTRSIGTQIAATQKGFLPYEQLSQNPEQLAADYERLRLSHELSREIALERDLSVLLNKILLTIFKFVHADRGVIFLMNRDAQLVPSAMLRRDGTDTPISVSSTIMNHVIRERATVLTHDAAMDFAASKGKSMILNRISSAIVAPLLHNQDILGVLWLDSEMLAQFQPKDMEMVTAISAQAAMFIEINILGKKIEQEIVNRERFSRLLSPNIAERVLSGELEVKKGGMLVPECTVFNSDIRGFTRMSEGAHPAAIVEMLNEYFELMVETLFKFDGTLDKFMGDGIMALWGAPVTHPDDAVRCVSCALEQLEVLNRFNKRRLEKGQPELGIGIGIHTGPVVAGYIGSSRALSYTVIGDTANTSARLCSTAAWGQILVSETTYSKISTKFECDELPTAQLKGKEKPFRIFGVKRAHPRSQVPAQISQLDPPAT